MLFLGVGALPGLRVLKQYFLSGKREFLERHFVSLWNFAPQGLAIVLIKYLLQITVILQIRRERVQTKRTVTSSPKPKLI